MTQRFPWRPIPLRTHWYGPPVLVGLSLVIVMFGSGSPIPGLMPNDALRLITGFLFGTTGALIALSPVGKRSGAHINPVVTLAFRLRKTRICGASDTSLHSCSAGYWARSRFSSGERPA